MNLKRMLVGGALKLFSLLPVKKVILFESSPDFACNAYPVYEYLKNSKKLPGWRFMWFVSGDRFIPSDFPRNDVVYIEPSGIKETLRHFYYRATAAALVMCNNAKYPARKKQLGVFLGHGCSAKNIKGLYPFGDKMDYVLSQSHFFDYIMCYEFEINPEQLFYTGYPRCDDLFHKCPEARQALGLSENDKLIIWLPTYRKHKNQTMEDNGSKGIPLLRTPEDVEKFTKVLEEQKVTVVLKPHPAEDLSTIENINTDRFKIITDEFLSKNKIRLYQVMSEADALISDYSSVLYDYLFCDKPFAITTDDAELYRSSRGFALDLVDLFKDATEELPDTDALCRFAEEVREGVDRKKDGRAEVLSLVARYNDDRSAERTGEFIIKNLKVKNK
ncbi:MAG: hypothetical protein E7660_04005 [Ruminococcaceae bacterium]|nr:hypothetical protein [Oscillospiraceae bacterium]